MDDFSEPLAISLICLQSKSLFSRFFPSNLSLLLLPWDLHLFNDLSLSDDQLFLSEESKHEQTRREKEWFVLQQATAMAPLQYFVIHREPVHGDSVIPKRVIFT
jgi:hypothetical protein